MDPAQVADDRYRILGRLGSGGMAEIFLARMRGVAGFERLVVIKRLLPHLKEQPGFLTMFIDEARIMASVRHRNVVTVHELTEVDGEFLLVMEYLEGESSARFLHMAKKEGTIDPWLGAYIVAEASAGLHAAHSVKDASGRPLNLVHRDVSPQNVFVTYEGEVKLLDFGVARTDNRLTKTETGAIKGKLAYMAPEQLSRDTIDRRVDIFAMGAVLYELTTGTRVFHRDNELQIVHAVCSDPIVPPSMLVEGYPPALEAICMKALEREPEARYQTANEMAQALRAALRTSPRGEHLEADLSSAMGLHFRDRIDRKHELIRATGDPDGPISDAARSIERVHGTPITQESRIITAERTAATPAPVRTRIAIGAGVVAAVAAITLAVALTRSGGEPDGEREAIPRAPPVAAPADVPPAAAPATVRIALSSVPPGASVRVGDSPPCVAPCTVERARSSEAIDVVGALAGHADARLAIVPENDQTLRLTMTPLAVGPTVTVGTPDAPAGTRPGTARRRTIGRRTDGRQQTTTTSPATQPPRQPDPQPEFPLFD